MAVNLFGVGVLAVAADTMDKRDWSLRIEAYERLKASLHERYPITSVSVTPASWSAPLFCRTSR
jgi:hypothetical protein